MHNSQRLFMIFSPFFTRFGRERPEEKPRWAIFSLVFALEIEGETAVFAKDLQKVPILREQRTVGKGKVGKGCFSQVSRSDCPRRCARGCDKPDWQGVQRRGR